MAKVIRRRPEPIATRFDPQAIPGRIPDVSACVSKTCLAHNANLIRRYCRRGVRLCAVVKADAYCHNARLVVGLLAQGWADCFAVATIEEAEEIYPLCRDHSILCMRPVYDGHPPELLRLAQAHGFHCTLASLEALSYVQRVLPPSRRKLNLHIKVDTGMGRVGVAPENAAPFVAAVRDSEKVGLAGIYTHFAAADEADLHFTRTQLARFESVLDQANLRDDSTVIKHACNSAAALRLPEAHFNMIRPGIALYGYLDDCCPADEPLRPVMKLKAPIMQVKLLRAGQSCGYSRTYVADKDMPIGIVPVGYADGLLRCLSNQAILRIGKYDAPVIGRVSMDQTILDLSRVPHPAEGMDVTIIDDQHDSPCSALTLARQANTICYEILTRIGTRVKRVLMD